MQPRDRIAVPSGRPERCCRLRVLCGARNSGAAGRQCGDGAGRGGHGVGRLADLRTVNDHPMRPSGMREAEPGLKTMPERKYLLTITVKYTGEFFMI